MATGSFRLIAAPPDTVGWLQGRPRRPVVSGFALVVSACGLVEPRTNKTREKCGLGEVPPDAQELVGAPYDHYDEEGPDQVPGQAVHQVVELDQLILVVVDQTIIIHLHQQQKKMK